MTDRKDLPSPTSNNFGTRVREEVMRLMGKLGDSADKAVTVRELVSAGLAKLKPSGGFEASPDIGGSSEPDLTPPPQPTGFAASAAISHVLIEHDAPTYTQGGGHGRTRVYGVTHTTGPLPTFAQAVELGQFSGTVWAMPSNPATTWRLWIKWETADGVVSPVPAGGTNGLAVTTGQDVSKMVQAMTGTGNPFTILTEPTTIGGFLYPAGTYSVQSFIIDGQITNAKIANLAVDNAKIASMSVDKLTAGSLAVGQHIQSTSYTAGSAGWRINADGTAELNNVTVRGTVYATNGQFSGTIFGGSAAGYGNGIGFFSGVTTGYRWRVGDPAGARIQWTGTAIEVYNSSNQLTMSSGGVTQGFGTNLSPNAALRFGIGTWDRYINTGAGRSGTIAHVFSANGAPNGYGAVQLSLTGPMSAGYDDSVHQNFAQIACTPGERLEVQAKVQVFRGNARLEAGFLDANNNFIGVVATGGVTEAYGDTAWDQNPSNFVHLWGFVTVPANAVRGKLEVRVRRTSTALNTDLYLAHPYIGRAGANQTQPSPWNDSVPFVTGSNASTYIANAAIGAAQIADASIGTAKIGDAAITSAKIGDAAVDTLKIANNAVTVPVGATVQSDVSLGFSSSWQTAASVSINTFGQPLYVSCMVKHIHYNPGGRTNQWGIRVNGVVYASTATPTAESQMITEPVVAYIQSPPSGNFAVELVGSSGGGGNNMILKSGSVIFAIGLRR